MTNRRVYVTVVCDGNGGIEPSEAFETKRMAEEYLAKRSQYVPNSIDAYIAWVARNIIEVPYFTEEEDR